MDNKWSSWTGIGRPANVAETDRVMVVMCGGDAPTLGPLRANTVDWNSVVLYCVVSGDAAHGWMDWNHCEGPALPPGARVMIVNKSGTTHGPYQSSELAWSQVVRYRRVDESAEMERLRAELADVKAARERIVDELTDQLNGMRASRDQMVTELANNLDQVRQELAAERTGGASALNLQRVFLASAEVREARAMYNHASANLERKLLLEQIATAVSRGHLPADFHTQLREWSK